MQPYSELANWDGSLSAPDSRSTSEHPSSSVQHTPNPFRVDVPAMLDPLSTDPNPLPLSLHDHPIYNPYPKHPRATDHNNNQVLIPLISCPFEFPADPNTRHLQPDHAAAHPHPSSAHSSSAPFDLPSSNNLFLPNGQDSDDVLSPQEREIMADITLDPDDPATWAAAEKGKDASGPSGSSGPLNNSQGEVRVNVLQVCL